MKLDSNLRSTMEVRDNFKNVVSLKKKMSRLKFMLLGILMIFVSSCKNDDPTNEQQKPLFPLNVGNSWTYDDTTPYGTTQVKMNILYSYTIDGKTGFALSEYKTGEPISLFKNDKDGNLVENLFNKDKFVHSTILYKKNVKKGDSWIYKSAVYTNGDYSKYEIEERIMTCIVSDTLITTPVGNFRCVGFLFHPGGNQANGDPNHTMIHYLSENVGRVKTLHYEHDNGRSWLFREQILTDYSLK